MQYKKSLFLFRRDLRLEDNTGLIFALKHSETVIPAFIFTPEQIENNPYRSDRCLKFMIESLEDLDGQLKEKGGKLYFFKGKPEDILKRLITELHIEALIVNRDYTPYSQKRDQTLENICKSHSLAFHSFDDALLHAPEETLKKDGKPYTVFTPYFRNASKQEICPPVRNQKSNYFCGLISFAEDRSILADISPKKAENTALIGGRKEALKILKSLSSYEYYGTLRDFPAEECTTRLSAYLKFTVCSPREVYVALFQTLGPHHDLIRSLYWRDFFTTIAFFFPHVFKGSFHPQFDALKWSQDQEAFHQWCEGTTGFPLVDAGLRQLKETGFMHNRLRLVTGSFLVKDLHISWQWGEKYFAQMLIDYDPCVNNGNWQWVASTGCDAQPYFRIFNPWNQQKKFDPDCLYIKKWIPELRSFTPEIIHTWDEKAHGTDYPAPILSHSQAAKKALDAYKAISKKTP